MALRHQFQAVVQFGSLRVVMTLRPNDYRVNAQELTALQLYPLILHVELGTRDHAIGRLNREMLRKQKVQGSRM
jgi:hypothetical protein